MFKRHVLKELSCYLDNQLTDKEKQRIEKHLLECKLCTQELDKLRLVSEGLKKWRIEELGPEFDSALKNKIVLQELERGQVKMEKRKLAILVPSGILVGILVFVFAVGLMPMYGRRRLDRRLHNPIDVVGGQFNEENRIPYQPSEMKMARVGVEEAHRGYGDKKFERSRGQSDLEKSVSSGVAFNNQVVGALPESNYIQDASPEQGSVIVIQPGLPATSEGQKVIRTADIRLEVEDGSDAYQKATAVCQELGGYLAGSNLYKDRNGRTTGTITMRIPKEKFLVALEKVSALGRVENSSSNSQDVSQEYSNLKARLDATMVVYTKMLEALQKRQTTIPEAIRLESELTPILQRIEDLKNRLEYLNNAISFTTITVNFREPEISSKILGETGRTIQESIITAKINAIRFLANVIRAIPALVGFVIWIAIILGAILVLKKLFIRIFKRG